RVPLYDLSRYNQGCLIRGLPISKAQIDPRVTGGSTFDLVETYQNGHAPERIIGREIVTWLNSGKKLGRFHYVTAVENVPSLPEGFKNYQSCTVAGKSLACAKYPAEPSYDAKAGEYRDCTPLNKSFVSRELYKGKYQMGSGRNIDAHITVERYT